LGILLHVELNETGPELELIGELLEGGVLDVDLLQALQVCKGHRECLKVLVLLKIQLFKTGQLAG
jgi:hypothetical protein